jgi:hypothetical protein
MRQAGEIRSEHERVRTTLSKVYNDAAGRDLNPHEQTRVAELDRRCFELESEYRRAREKELGTRIDWDFDPRGWMDGRGGADLSNKLLLSKGESVADWARARGMSTEMEGCGAEPRTADPWRRDR